MKSNSNNSTRQPGSQFENFTFLNSRFEIGFFAKIINDYFLLLFYGSSKLKRDPNDLFDKFLFLIFDSDPALLQPFSTQYFITAIYESLKPIESLELIDLHSKHRLLLAFMSDYLKKLEYSPKKIVTELYHLAGLLIILQHKQLKFKRCPKLVETSNSKIGFRHEHVIKSNTLVYKNDCKLALAHLDKTQPFGRAYTEIGLEYLDFLERFIGNTHNYTTLSLKKVLNIWHSHYKTHKQKEKDSKKASNPSIPGFGISENILTVNPYYLRGKPQGSNRKT